MNQRRVVIVSRVLPFHSPGGMQFVAWDLARALARLDLPVTVLTTRIPRREARFEQDRVHVEALEYTSPGRYSRRWWEESRRWVETRGADVGAVLSVSAGAYAMLRHRPHLPHVPFVMQAHGTSIGEIDSKLRTRNPVLWMRSLRNVGWLGRDLSTYRRFDRIVAVGSRVRDQLRSPPISWVVPAGKICLIENGIDTSSFRPDPESREEVRKALGYRPDDLVVTTVSRLHPQKGVREALRGFVEFARHRNGGAGAPRFLVIGDGSERERIAEEASRELPANSCRLLGNVERDRVPGLLNASDVFLFTTLHLEGLPLNVLEAAAVGLPLVLSRTLRKGLELAGPIEFVDPVRPDQISSALEAVSRRPDPAATAARTPALPERHTIERTAERYVSLLFPASHDG